jgi:hypothetical protein
MSSYQANAEHSAHGLQKPVLGCSVVLAIPNLGTYSDLEEILREPR